MKKFLTAISLMAFALIADQHLIPASQDKIFFASQSVCQTLANSINNARCVYVSAPSSMVKE